MTILAVYDIVGIQDYIFRSQKLSENIGASKLVAEVFSKMLPEAIRGITEHCVVEWRPSADRRAECLNPNVDVEIIYQGGGNAYVIFSEQKIFDAVTEDFLFTVYKETMGLGIAVAALETKLGNTYREDFKKLEKRLSIVKGNINRPMTAGNQPITVQSPLTGAPAVKYYDGEYVDGAQLLKRLKDLNLKREDKNRRFHDFDDLVFEKGTDSFLAVIHADGNNMGRDIRDKMGEWASYEAAVPKIRELSSRIESCYKDAMIKTQNSFSVAYKNKYQKDLPMINLIEDGDDITLVISGRLALEFTVTMLRNLESTEKEKRPFEESIPTACAGIVFFHAHYPFSEAYKLAEECCAEAKKQARIKNASFIDFHLLRSGQVSDLDTVRTLQYTVNGKSIIARPWEVSIGGSYEWVLQNHKEFKRWPTNKSKKLRDAIGTSDLEAKTVIDHVKARGHKIPDLPTNWIGQEHTSKYAPYLDILDIADVYENLLEEELSE